ncbi:MAG TPA: PIG-L family deacetylase [Anaerolineaceae bacterium]|nr:PIG-L family deacetylase [Anaerolineaceae bacterium]
MTWIYLSPHLDDAAFSCGGWIWEQARRGERVEVWTICAGDPPGGPLSPFAEELHVRWGAGAEAAAARREEDVQSCRELGAGYRHFSIPDCIYRVRPETGEPVIRGEDDLFDLDNPPEPGLVEELAALLAEQLPRDAALVSPLALGNHVDHRLVRKAAERARPGGQELFYYFDYPYIFKEGVRPEAAGGLTPVEGEISRAGLAAWQAAIAAHASQISSFWAGLDEMRAVLEGYWANGGGKVWRSDPRTRFMSLRGGSVQR